MVNVRYRRDFEDEKRRACEAAKYRAESATAIRGVAITQRERPLSVRQHGGEGKRRKPAITLPTLTFLKE